MTTTSKEEHNSVKLAQALIERKAIKTSIDELKKRIYQTAQIQEGEKSAEDPLLLLEMLTIEIQKYSSLIVRINNTNNLTHINKNMTLMQAIVQKDMFNLKLLIYQNLADKATPTNERYSQREIKYMPNVDILDIRKQANLISKQYRELDIKIQECNWTTNLL